MRIVHTSDWHIGKILNDYSLLEDQAFYFDKFIEKLSIIKPDALVIAGDLYDRSVPSADSIKLLNSVLCRILLDLKIKTFIIAGNHDSKERLSFVEDLLFQSGLYIAGNITNEIKKIALSGANFYLLPYLEIQDIKKIYPEENFKTYDEAIKKYTQNMIEKLDTDEINILVAHGFFSFSSNNCDGCFDKIGPSEIAYANIFNDFDYVALGHIHSKRSIGSEKMYYSGSPLKYSIDETLQDKQFLEVDIKKEKISVIIHKVDPLRDVKIIEGNFDEFITKPADNDYVFLHLTDNSIILNAMNRLKSVYKNILGLKYINIKFNTIDKMSRTTENLSSISPTDLFFEFYKLATEQDICDEDKLSITNIFNSLSGGQNDTY